jgi:serine/threonine protein phosphatase 1
MMKRTFAIGDIHGGLKALLQVLNKLEVTDDDTLIFMGDYVDGWSESAQVIELLITLSQKINCICIKGNHDVWCQNWLETSVVKPLWYLHGGKETMDSYEDFSKEQKQQHIDFLKKMPLYHLDAKNRLFLHAGFTAMQGVENEKNTATFYLDRTLWEMALVADERIDKEHKRYPKRLLQYAEIYIGHTPTTNLKETEPMHAMNIWNIDTGAAFKGRVSGINIDTKEFFQSDVLPSLYPNEKGRN